MTTLASQLDTVIRAVAPSIIGVSIGRRNDKLTWRIDFAPEATQVERDAAAGVVASFDSAAVESAEQIKAAALDALEGDVRSDALGRTLGNATGAEIRELINSVFPAMSAQQRAVLSLLLRFTVLRLRRG